MEVGVTMGEIVGAGLLAHVPTIMLPESIRLEINDGKERETSCCPAAHPSRHGIAP